MTSEKLPEVLHVFQVGDSTHRLDNALLTKSAEHKHLPVADANGRIGGPAVNDRSGWQELGNDAVFRLNLQFNRTVPADPRQHVEDHTGFLKLGLSEHGIGILHWVGSDNGNFANDPDRSLSSIPNSDRGVGE